MPVFGIAIKKPIPLPYSPPEGDEVNFNLGESYTPPDAYSVDFDLSDV